MKQVLLRLPDLSNLGERKKKFPRLFSLAPLRTDCFFFRLFINHGPPLPSIQAHLFTKSRQLPISRSIDTVAAVAASFALTLSRPALNVMVRAAR